VSFLDEYPPDWVRPQLRELHAALATAFYRTGDIVEVLVGAGVSPGDVTLDGSARTVWFSAIMVAAGHKKLPALVETASERLPAFRDRVEELLAAMPVLAAPLPSDQPDVLAPGDPRWKGFAEDGRERQIVDGDETMLDVSFLERGVERSAAVCRLTVSMASVQYWGTAFRVGPSLLLTNHHVLHDWENAEALPLSVIAAFGYQVDLAGRLGKAIEIEADVGTIVGERAHDWAVITAAEPIPPEIPILRLEAPKPVKVDDRVLIIQHPNGLPKKIALAHNLVRYVDNDVVQYWTDTEPGSSGSPVFNESWEVVALHHCWVDSPVKDGTAFRNQGRSIVRIAERLGDRGIQGVGA
jgi:V8-like Glu-specific endopeptidase